MECPLCFENDVTVKVKGCRHSFCASCAKEWFTRNEYATCPMCRGPFKCKEAREWIQEQMERDTFFEDGVNMILHARKVYKWVVVDMNGQEVMWGTRINKIEKLKEFQTIYNKYCDRLEFADDEDYEEFVLNTDVGELMKDEREEYIDDPTDRWVTKYPQLV